MNRFYLLVLCSIFFLADLPQSDAQQCNPSVPVLTVNLSGNPMGSWTSTNLTRNGFCCTASGGDRCIEFDITLDSSANGIKFDVVSGAIPPGALYYQVDCGPPAKVGDPLCLNGPGPHHLTFCKPGNNTNTYRITSIPKPLVDGTRWVSQACSGLLTAQGLADTSIHWTSVPSNPLYNSYLSCMNGCDSVTVTPTGSFPSYVDYRVCGLVIGGCYPTTFCDTIRINFVTDLVVNITPKNQTICYGAGAATVTANPIGGKAPYSYSWSTGETTQSINVLAGTYTVIMNDAMGCSVAYDTVSVFAFSAAINANAGPDQLLCIGSGQPVSLNGSITAATGGIWSGGGTFSPNNTTMSNIYTPSASEITAGFAQLMLVTTGNSGCPADTDYIRITIAPQPDPQVTGDFIPCQYKGATYTASCPATVSYSWSVTNGTIISPNGTNTINVAWNNAGSGSITLKATHASGCDSTITIPVTINPNPTPVITGSSTACTPSGSVFSVSNPTANSYAWSVSGGGIIGSSTGTSINAQWTYAGIGYVTVTETNNFGCDSSITVPVTLNSVPAPTLQGKPQVCVQETAHYWVPPVLNHTYQWQVIGGNIVSFTVDNSIDVYWYAVGGGTVSVNQISPAGCDSATAMLVVVSPKPAPAITGPLTVCENQDYSYTSLNQSGSMYFWTANGGNLTGNSSQGSSNIHWTTPGNGTITLQEIDSNGCVNNTNIPVLVNARPNPAITGSKTVCLNQQMTTYTATSQGGVSYQWSVNGGAITGGNGTNSITVQWTATGTYSVAVTTTNLSTGCDSSSVLMVSIDSLPKPVITANGLTGCSPLTVPFPGNQNPGGNTYYWSFGDGQISYAANPNHQYKNPGTYSVTLIVTSANGCSDSAKAQVAAYPSPVSYFTSYVSTDFYSANTSPFTVKNLSTGAIQYEWDFGNGDTSDVFEPAYTYNLPGSYVVTLTVTNSYGCKDTMTGILDIKVPEDIYIPNAFTPNGDHRNEGFKVVCKNITDLNVRIFDRWGEEIYYSGNKDFSWDGTYHGKEVKQDVYVYMIRATGYHGKAFDKVGSVTVVR